MHDPSVSLWDLRTIPLWSKWTKDLTLYCLNKIKEIMILILQNFRKPIRQTILLIGIIWWAQFQSYMFQIILEYLYIYKNFTKFQLQFNSREFQLQFQLQLREFQLQLQLQLRQVSWISIPTPTPGVSTPTPTPTPANLQNINSNSNSNSNSGGFNSNSNSNSGVGVGVEPNSNSNSGVDPNPGLVEQYFTNIAAIKNKGLL